MSLSHHDFSRHAARLAAKAASWAGDCLDSDGATPMRTESVERFIQEVRDRLARIEELSKP